MPSQKHVVVAILSRVDVRKALIGWAFVLQEQRYMNAWAKKVGWDIDWSENKQHADGMYKARIRGWLAVGRR